MRVRAWILCACLAGLTACAAKTDDPIPTAVYPDPAGTAEAADTLVVFLPGLGDRLGTYVDHQFVARLQAAGMGVDILEVDAHYGYYKSRTLLDCMRDDVLGPNRDRYEHIWIVGLSMGGLGALLTAEAYPDDVDGLVLIAPYLGRPKTLKAIDAEGGLPSWAPPAEVDERDWDVEVWRMLDAIAEGDDPTPVWLVFGEDDSGARAHRLLASGLPAGRVHTVPGGHTWPTWDRLWDWLLDQRVFEQEVPEQGVPEQRAPEAAP